jgi:hypothetical protein
MTCRLGILVELDVEVPSQRRGDPGQGCNNPPPPKDEPFDVDDNSTMTTTTASTIVRHLNLCWFSCFFINVVFKFV